MAATSQSLPRKHALRDHHISSCKEGPQQSLPSKWAEDAKLVVLEKLGSQIQLEDHFTDFHGFLGNSSARI